MSGRKNSISKLQIVNQGDLSAATTTSTVVNIQGLDNLTVQVNITTGTATGSFSVQGSVDHVETNGIVKTAGTFINLGSAYTQALTGSSPANFRIPIAAIADPYIQLVYTKTSGSGNFDAFVSGKAV